jgi:NADPH:quinone reductase-like Zn-dependent oxidoreductase
MAVGEGVSELKPGDRVCSTMIPDWPGGRPRVDQLRTTLGGPCDGMLAQERVMPQQALLKIPDGLSFEEAACLPVAGLTAWSSLVSEGGVGQGSKVLLLGTGGVSIMALGIAKKLGAEVAITSSSDEKLARAAAMGADHCINYRTRPDWAKAVLELYPQGVDCVLEVGGKGTFDQSVKATSVGGCVALIGVLAERDTAINLTAVLMRRIRVQGILVGSRGEFADYLNFVAEYKPEIVIDKVYDGLEHTGQALAHMAAGNHFGKIVIRVDGEGRG